MCVYKGGFALRTPPRLPASYLPRFSLRLHTNGSAGGTPCTPPLIVYSAMGSYPELCAKCNFYLCPFAIGILEKRTVSLVGHLPIFRVQFEYSNSLWFLVLRPFSQWAHASSCSLPLVRIFSGVLEKSENWDPTICDSNGIFVKQFLANSSVYKCPFSK